MQAVGHATAICSHTTRSPPRCEPSRDAPLPHTAHSAGLHAPLQHCSNSLFPPGHRLLPAPWSIRRQCAHGARGPSNSGTHGSLARTGRVALHNVTILAVLHNVTILVALHNVTILAVLHNVTIFHGVTRVCAGCAALGSSSTPPPAPAPPLLTPVTLPPLQRGVSLVPKTSSPARLLENISLFDFQLTVNRVTCDV